MSEPKRTRPERDDYEHWLAYHRAVVEFWAPEGWLIIGPWDKVSTQRKMDEGLVPFCAECMAGGIKNGEPIRGMTASRDECAEDGELVYAALAKVKP